MTEKKAFGFYRMIVEGGCLAFAWWAFDWKTAVLVLLILWAQNVARHWEKLQ